MDLPRQRRRCREHGNVEKKFVPFPFPSDFSHLTRNSATLSTAVCSDHDPGGDRTSLVARTEALFESRTWLWYRSQTMSRQFLKPCGILALSIALLYSGVAWTMEACMRHDGHSDHRVTGDHHNSAASSQHSHPEDQSAPVIHCTLLIHQGGPAVQVAATGIHRSDKGIALHPSLLPEAVSTVLGNNLWLEAVFKRIVTSSLPIDLARHLFLSILQI